MVPLAISPTHHAFAAPLRQRARFDILERMSDCVSPFDDTAIEPSDTRVAYGEHPDQFVDLFMPIDEEKGSILLIHGGYWRQRHALDLMEPVARHLASTGWAAVNVEYRRLSDNGDSVWPEMSADITAAAALTTARPMIAMGHSAGGQLALWVAANSGRVDAAVALAPVSDLRAADEQNLSDGAVRDLLGGSATEVPDRYDDASPRSRLPLGVPQLIIHGDDDESVPQQMSFDYTAAAIDAGDEIRFAAFAAVDHMQLIDPANRTWRTVHAQLEEWADTLRR